MEYTHKSVLLNECIDALNIRPDGVYVDGTLGRAGHSKEIVQRLATGRLICIDRDMAAIEAAKERLAPWMDRVTLVHGNFAELDTELREAGITGAASCGRQAPPAPTGCCSTWAYPRPSWMTPPGAFPTCRMLRWTCGWTPPLP